MNDFIDFLKFNAIHCDITFDSLNEKLLSAKKKTVERRYLRFRICWREKQQTVVLHANQFIFGKK
jgi:hypothetical protein